MNSAIWVSVTVASASTLLSVPPAVFVAWYLEKSRWPGRWLVGTLVMLPLVLPPVVVGYLLLRTFSPRGAFGAFLAEVGLPVAFHWLGAVIAAAVAGFPFAVISVGLAMKAIDPRLDRISQSLGRSGMATFWRVTLPLCWPGILAGGAIAFARGLGEFGATIVLAGRIPGETETIALKIYSELDSPGGEGRIGLLVATSVALCIVCVLVARALDRLHRRRLELDR